MDVVSVVEAAYDLSGTDGEWLKKLALVARPSLDHGFGVVAYLLDTRHRSGGRVGALACAGTPRWTLRSIPSMHAEGPADVVRYAYAHSDGCNTLSEVLSPWGDLSNIPTFKKHAIARGVHDALGVIAIDATGNGCVLSAGLPKTMKLSRKWRIKWQRIGAHISAGVRLRRGLGALASRKTVLDGAEAIFDKPRGHLLHAVGPAKHPQAIAVLREASRRIDEARGTLRKNDPEEALSVWRALIRGRWSLVDCFDSDGRRFLVARRNDPQVADPRKLTPRERQLVRYAARGYTLKRMSYELGLSPSTVGTHLARAVQKLGLRSRTDLIQLVSPAR